MKRAIIITLTAALFSAFAAEARPQDRLVLNLEDSIRMALERNPLYQAEKAKEDQASAGVRQAVAAFFPSLNASGSNILDKKVFTIEFPSFIPGEPPQRFKVDFTRPYQMTFNFSMPLYTGGQLTAGFKQANYNLDSSREAIRQARNETVFNVKKAFYGVLLARKFVEVSEEAVSLAEKHLKNVVNLYDVGMASKFDRLRSEVQLANLKPQLIRARNSLVGAELGLKVLLGLDLAAAVDFKGELAFKDIEVRTDENIAKALAQRPEISQLRAQRLMADEALTMARASFLPTVAIGGAYNYWADGLNFRKGTWESFYQVNLVVNIPIFNGFSAHAKVSQSKALIRQLDYSQKGLAEAVKMEVQQSILALQQARESLLSQEKNVEQAMEAVRIAELNYAEGLATNLDVSSVQVALSEARTNLTQALFDYAVALAQLEKAVGADQTAYEKSR